MTLDSPDHAFTANLLIELSSADASTRRRAAGEILSRTHEEGFDEVEALPQRTVRLFEEQWRSLASRRDDLIASLSRLIVDRETDLLSVNLLAYALASAGEDGVAELLQLLEHPDFPVRTYAAEGLGSLDNRARWAVPALCRFLDRSAADWTGFTIIRALGNIGGVQAIAVLQSIAGDARRRAPPDEELLHALEGALSVALSQA